MRHGILNKIQCFEILNTAKAQLLTNFMINHKKIIYLKVYFVNHIVRSFNTLLIQYGLPELCKYS